MLDWLRPKQDDLPRIKGFEIQKHIFSGAFSNIYKALRKKTGEPVALKVLTVAGSRIAALLKKHPKHLWEGELLSSLDHPNIVKCVDYSRKPPFWLAMEFIESQLKQYIGRCQNAEEEAVIVNALSQLAAAVDYLHGRGLVHRDLCMSNILLDQNLMLKLIDFGLTVPIDSSVTRGRAGTPSYMAPEMIRKWRHTETTDIYSYGVIMYELLTGVKPFKGVLREQRMNRSLNINPPLPSRMGRFISPDVEEVLIKCLFKDPGARFGSTGELDKTMFLLCRKRGN
jgi:serine/threonine protein kinase